MKVVSGTEVLLDAVIKKAEISRDAIGGMNLDDLTPLRIANELSMIHELIANLAIATKSLVKAKP